MLKMDVNEEEKKESRNISWLAWAIMAGLFVLAIYLSWSCNSATNPDLSVLLKALRALLAGLFWPIYLVLYMVLWAGKPCSASA